MTLYMFLIHTNDMFLVHTKARDKYIMPTFPPIMLCSSAQLLSYYSFPGAAIVLILNGETYMHVAIETHSLWSSAECSSSCQGCVLLDCTLTTRVREFCYFGHHTLPTRCPINLDGLILQQQGSPGCIVRHHNL